MDNIVTNGILWQTIFCVAFAAIGLMETIKGFFKTPPTVQVSSLIAFGLCFGLFAVSEFVSKWILYAADAGALMQLGYQVFLQDIPLLVKKLFNVEKE